MIESLPDSFKQYEDELSMKRAINQMIQNKIQQGIDDGKLGPDCDRTVLQVILTSKDNEFLWMKKDLRAKIDDFAADHIKLIESVQNKKRF